MAAARSSATSFLRPKIPTVPPASTIASINAPPKIPVPPVTTITLPLRLNDSKIFIDLTFEICKQVAKQIKV